MSIADFCPYAQEFEWKPEEQATVSILFPPIFNFGFGAKIVNSNCDAQDRRDSRCEIAANTPEDGQFHEVSL